MCTLSISELAVETEALSTERNADVRFSSPAGVTSLIHTAAISVTLTLPSLSTGMIVNETAMPTFASAAKSTSAPERLCVPANEYGTFISVAMLPSIDTSPGSWNVMSRTCSPVHSGSSSRSSRAT